MGSTLGTSGPNKDGVDGEWGPTTEGALFKQLGITIAPAPVSSVGKIPAAYSWLAQVQGVPLLVVEGIKLLGTREVAGAGNNPTIMSWAEEVGVPALGYRYTGDAVPWCGLFMAVVAKRASKTIPYGPLYALNWGAFGAEVHQPGLGDVLTFLRDGGGHVGLYIAEDRGTKANGYEDAAYHVLGGNQGDSVSITRVLKKRMKAARRPSYKVAPTGVRPYVVAATGGLSTNEA